MKKVKNILVLLVFFYISLETKAQITIKNVEEIEKLKSGTTYVVLNNEDSSACQKYLDIFKKYWTISKIEFINVGEVEEHFTPGNFFFTLDGKRTSTQSGATGTGYRTISAFVNWNLWRPEDNYLEKGKKKKLDDNDKMQIARIELYPDFEIWNFAAGLSAYNCNQSDHFYNYGPGIFKNYLQQLMRDLQNPGKGKTINFDFQDQEKLQELKTQTLFVPDYLRLNYPLTIGMPLKNDRDVNELFEKYPYKYEIVSLEDLNNKILDESKPLYYLLYVRINLQKFVNVVNSKTGEIIYANYTAAHINLKDGDISTIAKIIKQ